MTGPDRQASWRQEPSPVTCPSCWAPVTLDHNQRITKHAEQIVTAYGWGDGYTQCAGSGKAPRLIDKPPPKDTPADLTAEQRQQQLLGNVATLRVRRLSRGGRVTVFNGKSSWDANPVTLNQLLDLDLIWVDGSGRYWLTAAGVACHKQVVS